MPAVAARRGAGLESKALEDPEVDAVLEKKQVQRAYELLAPVYDFIFDWIFAPGRAAASNTLSDLPDLILRV